MTKEILIHQKVLCITTQPLTNTLGVLGVSYYQFTSGNLQCGCILASESIFIKRPPFWIQTWKKLGGGWGQKCTFGSLRTLRS